MSRRGVLPWTPEEDEFVRRQVSEQGRCWTQIGDSLLRKRTGKQVRERFLFILDPTLNADVDPETGKVKRVEWSKTEDEVLLAAVFHEGNKWKSIKEKYFATSRSESDIKNRYNSTAFATSMRGVNASMLSHVLDEKTGSASVDDSASVAARLQALSVSASPTSSFLPVVQIPMSSSLQSFSGKTSPGSGSSEFLFLLSDVSMMVGSGKHPVLPGAGMEIDTPPDTGESSKWYGGEGWSSKSASASNEQKPEKTAPGWSAKWNAMYGEGGQPEVTSSDSCHRTKTYRPDDPNWWP